MNIENNSSEQWYKFNPTSSINTYELARVIEQIYQLRVDKYVFNSLPKDLKKHFQKITEAEAKES